MSNISINMFLFLYVFLFILITKTVSSWEHEISNYYLYKVTAFNLHERTILYDLNIRVDSVIFLNGVTNDAALPMDVVVHECCAVQFEMILQDQFIEHDNGGYM